ncbi:MAG TPA: ATP-binding protein, partial [Steroidobacteraceae bacterium]|nr:ATP-binding protein [Steroidobacteraceae bacterium]
LALRSDPGREIAHEPDETWRFALDLADGQRGGEQASVLAPRLYLTADAVQLQQVLINLIRNGIDAMQQAGSTRRDIVVSARAVPEGVEFAVRDFGPGLEPIALANLFNPFFTTKANGTGLGLAISRTIVNAHGGKLALGPVDEPGACFRFTLPAAEGST